MHLQDTVAPLATSRPRTKLGAHGAHDTWEYGLHARALCLGLRPQFNLLQRYPKLVDSILDDLLGTAQLLGNLGSGFAG